MYILGYVIGALQGQRFWGQEMFRLKWGPKSLINFCLGLRQRVQTARKKDVGKFWEQIFYFFSHEEKRNKVDYLFLLFEIIFILFEKKSFIRTYSYILQLLEKIMKQLRYPNNLLHLRHFKIVKITSWALSD